jgi:arsenate reductase-like glutaredoxin family protein
MDMSYSFLSDEEPTDEQLEALMQAVSEDVKERAAKADEKFKAMLKQQLEQTQKEWELKHGINKDK